jgi:myo-inositol 2-dehydrogenase/D-chiro-inositol 1-dehydrogenase
MTYRAAIVGCGRIASTIQDEFEGRPGLQLFPYSHAGAYRACARTELVAAADPSPERRQAFGERWAVDALYESVEELLAHERIDLVSICAPTREHERIFELVAGRVRGVLLEKPVGITLAEADRMVERARAAGVHVAVDHTRTYDSWYRQAKRVLDDGLIGEVRTVFALWAEGWSGGGSHLFDLLRFFTGSEPEWVFCHGDGSGEPDAGGSAYLHYRNGVRAHVEAPVGGVAPLEVDVVGTSGRLRIGTHRAQLFVNDSRLGYPVPAEWPFFGRMEPVSGLEQAVTELAAALDGGPEPASTLEHARSALEIAVALNRSAETGVRVDLPITDRSAGVEAF